MAYIYRTTCFLPLCWKKIQRRTSATQTSVAKNHVFNCKKYKQVYYSEHSNHITELWFNLRHLLSPHKILVATLVRFYHCSFREKCKQFFFLNLQRTEHHSKQESFHVILRSYIFLRSHLTFIDIRITSHGTDYLCVNVWKWFNVKDA